MLKSELGLISAIINASTMIPYIYGVVRGQARPNRATWTVWTFLAWVIFLASWASGAHATLFWLASAAFNSTLVMLLSFWRGDWHRSSLEVGCLAAGLAGVVAWYYTHHAFISVYIGCLVDIVAVIPTVRKVWQRPKSEPIIAWSLGFVAAILNALAIDQFRPVIFIPPLVVLCWHVAVLTPMYQAILRPGKIPY